MGHSCGGGLAVQLAAEDARVSRPGQSGYSGAGSAGAGGNDAASLKKIRGPHPAHHRRRAERHRVRKRQVHIRRHRARTDSSTGGRTTCSTSAPSAPGTAATTARRTELARMDDAQRSERGTDVQRRGLHAVQGPVVAHPEEEDRRPRARGRVSRCRGRGNRRCPKARARHRHVAARHAPPADRPVRVQRGLRPLEDRPATRRGRIRRQTRASIGNRVVRLAIGRAELRP